MILEKSFRVFHKMKPVLIHGGAVLGIIGLFNFANLVDITGHIRFVPNAGDVRGVYINWTWMLDNEQDEMMREAMFITDRNVVNRTISVHSHIIAERRQLRRVFLASIFSDYRAEVYDERRWNRTWQNIVYLMNDGTEVRRQYLVTRTMLEESGMTALFREDAVIMQQVYWLMFPEKMDLVTVMRSSQRWWDSETERWIESGTPFMINIANPAHISQLFDAARLDYLISMRDEYFYSTHDGSLGISAYIPRQQGRRWSSDYYQSFGSFDNIMNWLERTGYLPGTSDHFLPNR
jgi:hypothetical protein